MKDLSVNFYQTDHFEHSVWHHQALASKSGKKIVQDK
ncbi:uncharacterized protein METZ01_LOCUS92034 [marine metagenome]|uniref:Uncharacterized protein n=1 Tax=marine metagenome TaxID=408172 RepID=A0A381VFS3_9ZZZZ